MKQPLAATRDRLAQRRQSWLFGWRPYHRLKRPAWARGGDTPFECIYQDYKQLLKTGTVVWGVVVQANNLLMKPGPDDCPAAALFSLDPFFDDKLQTLAELAGVLFSMKGQNIRDPEVVKFATAITNEEDVLFNRELPHSLTFGRTVYYTTIMVHRKHLPLGFLNTGFFPLLADPEATEASIILPARYWDPGLVELWKQAKSRKRK